jgi:hypothetical protein
MAKRSMCALAAVFTAAFSVGAAKAAKPWIKGSTDKSPIEYSVGEKMTFTLTLEKAGSLPKGLDRPRHDRRMAPGIGTECGGD